MTGKIKQSKYALDRQLIAKRHKRLLLLAKTQTDYCMRKFSVSAMQLSSKGNETQFSW